MYIYIYIVCFIRWAVRRGLGFESRGWENDARFAIVCCSCNGAFGSDPSTAYPQGQGEVRQETKTSRDTLPDGAAQHDMAVSTLFAPKASTETLNGTIVDVTCFKGAKQKLHPKPYRLAKRTSLRNVLALTKQKPPYRALPVKRAARGVVRPRVEPLLVEEVGDHGVGRGLQHHRVALTEGVRREASWELCLLCYYQLCVLCLCILVFSLYC